MGNVVVDSFHLVPFHRRKPGRSHFDIVSI